MPIIEIHLIEGRTEDVKRRLVKQLTGTICSCLEVRPEQVRIIIDEMETDNYSIAGKLMKDLISEKEVPADK